jgi:hypothetical protein
MKSVIAVIIGAVIIYAVILRITEDSGVSKNAPEGFISPKLEDNRNTEQRWKDTSEWQKNRKQ